MFHVECESHLSGARNIQFCYCSYDLCNSAGPSHAPAPRGWSLAALVLALHWALAAGTRIMSSLL